MVRIRFGAEVCQQLDGVAEPVEVCDATGRVIGLFLPDGIPAAIKRGVPPADLPVPLTAEELAVRRQSRTGRTLEEILRGLGQQ
jgi:hypothetical protein